MIEIHDFNITVGREETLSDLVLPYPVISGEHVSIVRKGNDLTIRDLSRNGIWVNGARVAKMKSDSFIPVKPTDDLRLASAFGYPLQVHTIQVETLSDHGIMIGRDKSNDINFPDPHLSKQHAKLYFKENVCYIDKIDDGAAVYLNGSQIEKATPIKSTDTIFFASYQMKVNPIRKKIILFLPFGGNYLSVKNLSYSFADRKSKSKKKTLLDNVSFEAQAGEFIGLIGPSGAGKSTLLKAICGIVKPESGSIFFDGDDLAVYYESLKTQIGYAPQEDIVHQELTVEESLSYTAKLRFAEDITKSEIEQHVNNSLQKLDLMHRRDTLISKISGGQRKRVNLAQELLNPNTNLLFLDEPTSGLDPNTDAEVMKLLRKLADDDTRTIIVVTHNITLENMQVLDKVVILAPGGKLAFFGTPQEALTYFQVDHPADIFKRLSDNITPDEWQQRYTNSEFYQNYYVGSEVSVEFPSPIIASPQKTEKPHQQHSPFIPQLKTLVSRYSTIMLRDRSNLFVLLIQPVVIGIFMLLLFEKITVEFLFTLCFSAFWFGCSSSIRELIRERAIYNRERMVNLRITTYLGSKLLVLFWLDIVQCMILLGVLLLPEYVSDYVLFNDLYGVNLVELAVVLAITSFVGTSLGLLISSLFNSSEAAVGIMLIFLIPQILFSGVIVPFGEMPQKWISNLTICRWSLEAAIKCSSKIDMYNPASELIYKWDEKTLDFIFENRLALRPDLGVDSLRNTHQLPMHWILQLPELLDTSSDEDSLLKASYVGSSKLLISNLKQDSLNQLYVVSNDNKPISGVSPPFGLRFFAQTSEIDSLLVDKPYLGGITNKIRFFFSFDDNGRSIGFSLWVLELLHILFVYFFLGAAHLILKNNWTEFWHFYS